MAKTRSAKASVLREKKYSVKATMTALELHKNTGGALHVDVNSGGKKLGTLELGQGSLCWIPSGNSVNVHRLSWEQFAALMEGR